MSGLSRQDNPKIRALVRLADDILQRQIALLKAFLRLVPGLVPLIVADALVLNFFPCLLKERTQTLFLQIFLEILQTVQVQIALHAHHPGILPPLVFPKALRAQMRVAGAVFSRDFQQVYLIRVKDKLYAKSGKILLAVRAFRIPDRVLLLHHPDDVLAVLAHQGKLHRPSLAVRQRKAQLFGQRLANRPAVYHHDILPYRFTVYLVLHSFPSSDMSAFVFRRKPLRVSNCVYADPLFYLLSFSRKTSEFMS